MASGFSSEDICEGEDCEAITDVTYYVKKKKKLCDDCASKEGCIGKARKGRPNLYCEKHDEEIKLYCKTHCEGLCLVCASIDHRQHKCVHQDIEGALVENRAKLNALKEQTKDKLKLYHDYGSQIYQCRKDTDAHLQAIKNELDSTINEAKKISKDREQEDASKINKEINGKNNKLREEIQKMYDEIQRNDEDRKERLELNSKIAVKRLGSIDIKQQVIDTDIQDICEEINKKIGELEKLWKDHMNTTEKTLQTLDRVIEEDRYVVKDGHRVNASVADELKKPLVEDGVKHITRTVSGVRFVRGVGREKYNGRIDGYDWEWKLTDTISVRDEVTFPGIVGCIDECHVIITEDTCLTYMLDMNTRTTQKVTIGSDRSWILSCALLNDEKVVCGKCHDFVTRDRLTGCISVYDRQWKLMNDVTIPRNTTDGDTMVDVAVDQDGMIISAEPGQPKIYVINPADGKIINTIKNKENVKMCGVLSSGHIIARPSPPDHRVFIIDREGARREIPHSDEILNTCIDPITDDLYVVTSDDECKTCVIDQVMSGGDMKERRVASFPISTRIDTINNWGYLLWSRVMMASSGKMIACDGDNILVYKKLFSI